ncbi:hypothetical protein EUX98_g6089 [Antrodiella citrinella]|uniref:Uncharacterized protein n=1 Tax=Antrodiella citrinella TaxID=2447956 RepID=A0A4S4MQV2_9APHY|nr:hypothetical protein EUX98_g6089 [Antrodiella citrinella]
MEPEAQKVDETIFKHTIQESGARAKRFKSADPAGGQNEDDSDEV